MTYLPPLPSPQSHRLHASPMDAYGGAAFDDGFFEQFSDLLRVQGRPLVLSDPIWKYDVSQSRRGNQDLGGQSAVKAAAGHNLNQSSPGWKRSSAKVNKDFFEPIAKKNLEDFPNKNGKKKVFPKNKNNINNNNNNNNNDNDKNADKRFKTIQEKEALPRNQAVGGYIFVCNNDTMPENLERMLFGLPLRYKDSVRAIIPGLPLFLYNYSTHLLHGIYEAASFGGTNIDPSAWANDGETRFPAQVKATVRKVYEPLEENDFRPFLHHYDGTKFRLELSVPEALALLDTFDAKRGSGYC